MVVAASELKRTPCAFGELVIGVECGGSDATSGIASNPVTGIFADRFIDEGGTIILSEPAEFMGAEHILAARTPDEGNRRRLLEMVKWFEDEAKRCGVDMRGTNPTPDNIKGGSRPVVEIVEYAEAPSKNGLVIMNTPSAQNATAKGAWRPRSVDE